MAPTLVALAACPSLSYVLLSPCRLIACHFHLHSTDSPSHVLAPSLARSSSLVRLSLLRALPSCPRDLQFASNYPSPLPLFLGAQPDSWCSSLPVVLYHQNVREPLLFPDAAFAPSRSLAHPYPFVLKIRLLSCKRIALSRVWGRRTWEEASVSGIVAGGRTGHNLGSYLFLCPFEVMASVAFR